MLTYVPPDYVRLDHDVVGPVEISTIIEVRGTVVSHYETAVRVGAGHFEVVDTYSCSADSAGGHAALVAAISSCWSAL